jgi:hypothetical protein
VSIIFPGPPRGQLPQNRKKQIGAGWVSEIRARLARTTDRRFTRAHDPIVAFGSSKRRSRCEGGRWIEPDFVSRIRGNGCATSFFSLPLRSRLDVRSPSSSSSLPRIIIRTPLVATSTSQGRRDLDHSKPYSKGPFFPDERL